MERSQDREESCICSEGRDWAGNTFGGGDCLGGIFFFFFLLPRHIESWARDQIQATAANYTVATLGQAKDRTCILGSQKTLPILLCHSRNSKAVFKVPGLAELTLGALDYKAQCIQ